MLRRKVINEVMREVEREVKKERREGMERQSAGVWSDERN